MRGVKVQSNEKETRDRKSTGLSCRPEVREESFG